METKNLKDKLTNYLAVFIVVATAVQTYLKGVDNIDWFQLALAVVVALVSYFTGKPIDLKK